jgi:tetratricopeptide (TPR) repeat protein
MALLAARGAAAQLPDAEDAFRRGDYGAARAAYEQVLARDSLNVRALYRLATLDAWDGALERSLARFERLRRLEPHDPDIMVAHARAWSWANRFAAALATYDSVLARWPGRADALAGRARTVAWSGDLARAEQLWRAALEQHPQDAELHVGLAQTLLWRGQPALAESYAARARQLVPDDRSAQDVLALIRVALAPELSSRAGYLRDSDRNGLFTHAASYSLSLGGARRGVLYGSWRRADDPLRSGGSYTFGGRVIAPVGSRLSARLALGAHALDPDSGATRVMLAPDVGAGLRISRGLVASAAWRRGYFDETAPLLRRHFVIETLDLDVELGAPRLSVAVGGGAAWLTDNRRWSAILAVMVGAARGVEIGVRARAFGYDTPNPGTGDFAPDFFGVVEGRARLARRWNRWGLRADGGLGSQQVGTGAPRQTAWQAALAVSRMWRVNDELTVSAAMTNSAGSSVTGAYRSWSLNLEWRQSL